MTYKPSETDVTWARELVEHLVDGGIWCAPATGLMYQFDKKRKVMTMLNHPKLLDRSFDAFVMHEQTRVVFGEIGWEME